MLKRCSGNDASHAVTDKVYNHFFLIQISSDVIFYLVSELFAHFLDISFGVILIFPWKKIISQGQLRLDPFLDYRHIIRTSLKPVTHDDEHLSFVVQQIFKLYVHLTKKLFIAIKIVRLLSIVGGGVRMGVLLVFIILVLSIVLYGIRFDCWSGIRIHRFLLLWWVALFVAILANPLNLTDAHGLLHAFLHVLG